MKVKFSRCTSSNLANVPLVDGQLIYTKDTGECYIDVNNTRNKVSDIMTVSNISNIPTPIDSKLYYDLDTDILYKSKTNNGQVEWVNITGATVNYVDNNFLKKDNIVAYTPTANYHPATKQYVDSAIANSITNALGGDY